MQKRLVAGAADPYAPRVTEQWTCTRCSAKNESWAVGCSSCGAVRADLSVAGSLPESAVPPDTTPDIAPVQPTETAASPQPATRVPAWGGTVATPPPPAADATGAIPGGADTGTWTPPPQQENVPFWRRIPIGTVIFIVILAAGAIGGLIFNASRGDGGAITKGGNLEVTDLRVGDCWDLKDPNAEEIGEVTAVPCSAEHEYEMYFTGSMSEGTYPTDDAFNTWLEANCLPAFDAYVGISYQDSDLEIFPLTPTEAGWNGGDRLVQCALFHPRVHRLTESLKGSAQ